MTAALISVEQPVLYAVVGNPVKHSQSPLIHSLFAAQTGILLSYEKKCVAIDGFAPAVYEFMAAGGRGLNVTVPFKCEAYLLAHQLTERARLAGAVNTLKFSDNQIYADNTDGIGLVADLVKNLNYDLADKKILLLGAGGAARGVLHALLECCPAAIYIANRTASRAQALAQEFIRLTKYTQVAGGSIEQINGHYDLLINASASSLENQVPNLPTSSWTFELVYDMMYGAKPTALMRGAQTYGIRNVDGLGMLIEQAAYAFLFWHGVLPSTAPLFTAVRQAMNDH